MTLPLKTPANDRRESGDAAPFDLHEYTYLPDSAVFNISSKAFDLIHRYGMPPDPISYAVWFTYASKSHAFLQQKIDEQLQSRGKISRQEVALIYRNYLEDSYVSDSQQNLSLELETSLSEINDTMEDCSIAYRKYATSLGGAHKRISAAKTAEALAEVTEDMLTQNKHVIEVTEQLRSDLDESRAHIRRLNQQLEDLQNLSLKDPLTGVSNRRAFDTHLKNQIAIAQKDGTELSVAFADLDHFKRVNDKLGHQIGDVVLKYFSKLLVNEAPENVIVARYGGEEFALILPGMGRVRAHNLANRFCYDFAKQRFLGESQHSEIGALTASFGVSSYVPGRSSYELLEIADTKLYEAKNAGRNCVRTEGIN